MPPRKDLHAAPHGVRFAGVIEIAAGRQQDRAPRVIELTEVSLVFGRERGNAGVRDDASVAAPEDELALVELPQCEDTQTLAPRVAHGNVFDHR